MERDLGNVVTPVVVVASKIFLAIYTWQRKVVVSIAGTVEHWFVV
jgi:hypothetical protein